MTLSDMAIRHSVSRSLPVRRRIKSVRASAEAQLKSIRVHLCSHPKSTASDYIGFNSFANPCLSNNTWTGYDELSYNYNRQLYQKCADKRKIFTRCHQVCAQQGTCALTLVQASSNSLTISSGSGPPSLHENATRSVTLDSNMMVFTYQFLRVGSSWLTLLIPIKTASSGPSTLWCCSHL